MTGDVHLISAEQASYLDAVLWARRADDPLPACPVCGEHPTETANDRLRDMVTFVGCGHRISVDLRSLAEWYATETPWTRLFEEMAHRRQIETLRGHR